MTYIAKDWFALCNSACCTITTGFYIFYSFFFLANKYITYKEKHDNVRYKGGKNTDYIDSPVRKYFYEQRKLSYVIKMLLNIKRYYNAKCQVEKYSMKP